MHNDPLLTQLGLRQARSAGRFLHEHFVEKPQQAHPDGNAPKVKIITSPYMRTVMTAAEVARAFGEPSIAVENRLCELQGPLAHHEFPMGDWLIVRDSRFKAEVHEFLDGDPARASAPVELIDS